MQGQRLTCGPFELDPVTQVVQRGGQSLLLGQKSVLLLAALFRRPGEVLTKSELMDAAWPGTSVEESNLTVQIAALRKVLGVTQDGNEWIVTVPRVGYRFISANARERSRDASVQPSIAVLPFSSISESASYDPFAAGLAEDLITDLSAVRGLTVIARNSSFAQRKGADPNEFAKQLGVDYLVQGSLRRAATRVRINVQLIERARNAQIWAERFDGELADVFALQDQVVARIVAALQNVLPLGVVPDNKSRRPTNLEAYELFARGRPLVVESPQGFREGQPFLQKAVSLDPDFAAAHAWLAMGHIHAWHNWGLPESLHRSPAMIAATRAVQLDPENADAQAVFGYLLAFEGAGTEGMRAFELALRLNPNHADALALLGEAAVHVDRPERGVEAVKRAFELNPFPPAWYHWTLGFALYAAGQYQDAITTLGHERTLRTGSLRLLAASLAQVGRLDEARAVGRNFLDLVPTFTIAEWGSSQHFETDAMRQRFADGYRLAGLPD